MLLDRFHTKRNGTNWLLSHHPLRNPCALFITERYRGGIVNECEIDHKSEIDKFLDMRLMNFIYIYKRLTNHFWFER
jgi:hypothetical protein